MVGVSVRNVPEGKASRWKSMRLRSWWPELMRWLRAWGGWLRDLTGVSSGKQLEQILAEAARDAPGFCPSRPARRRGERSLLRS